MIPRSKQPNDFDYFSGADQGVGRPGVEWYASGEAEEDPFLLDDGGGEAGAGGGQLVTEEGRLSPVDFSGEELALARDLHSLFPLEQEQLPPRFVQTLTAQPRDWAAPTGLVQRVTYRVFHHLRLPRRLFAEAPPLAAERSRGLLAFGRAPRTVALSTLLALVVLSLVTIAPSFAQGLRVLVGQTGVQVAPNYPKTLFLPQGQVRYLSLRALQEAVPFQVSWLGQTPGAYQFRGLVLHMGQLWADGPVVELQYGHVNPQGSYGQLLVREFRPAAGATVLQVVAKGAAHPVQVDKKQAIYIDGQWVHQRQGIVWRYGTRAELIYQTDGLIFWITADQRDGADEAMLEGLAQVLEPLYLGQPRPMLPELYQPHSAQVAAALSPASLGEVIALIPAGVSPETGAAVYIALGSPPDDSR